MSGRKQDGDWTTAAGAALLLVGALLCLPGLLAAFLAGRMFSLPLDRAALWAFGATASGVLWLALSLASSSLWSGFKRHALVSVATAWLIGLAGWGFKAHWVHDLWRACMP